MKALGIYIHIPFCVKKCGYCDFQSMPAGPDMHRRYIEALINEIRGCETKFGFSAGEYEVRTIYIGGGTPSVIEPAYIKNILETVEEVFGYRDLTDAPEITIEVNPGTVTEEKLAVYREAGINRLSIGLQSADDKELKALGRIHSYSDFEKTYHAAREAGFDNINVDIMTAIPYQTMESLRRTIDTVAGLNTTPEHISAYSLILEEGTPFYEKYAVNQDNGDEAGGDRGYNKGSYKAEEQNIAEYGLRSKQQTGTGDGMNLPGEDEEREMYHFAVERLAQYGYHRYEISNFARPGYESRHNSSYWTGTDYLGLGVGASSLIDNVRYRNTTQMKEYMNAPVSSLGFDEELRLGLSDRMEEFMFLGLRMSSGISEDEFVRRFGRTVDESFGNVLEKLIVDGLIERNGGRIRLTEEGIDYGNYVFSRFLEPDISDQPR
ncbi:MAG: radical SAM protein [Lachnospiraceae bacterium]|nr:radical SAM protein [Lachnospiraceae bacterium]